MRKLLRRRLTGPRDQGSAAVCTVSLAGLAQLRLGGETLTSTFASPIDMYRGSP
jgi:hypothetical protein